MPRFSWPVTAALLLAVVAAGCGGSSTPAATGSSPSPTAAAASSSCPPTDGKDQIGGSVSTDMSRKPEVQVPTGPVSDCLQTKDIVVGKGPVAGPTSTVEVQYLGLHYSTGQPFDSSWDRGAQPVSFPLTGVIPGFAQGIAGMHVGGRRELVVPPALGYPQGTPDGSIKPGETLVFVVDLVKVS